MNAKSIPKVFIAAQAGGGAAASSPAQPGTAGPASVTGSQSSSDGWVWCAVGATIFVIIFFPLRERKIEMVAGIWWVRVVFLLFIALLLAGDGDTPVSVKMFGVCLAVVYVLANNVFTLRNVPILSDSGVDEGAAAPAHATDAADPEQQIAAVRHRQYADLIQRCLDPARQASDACQQLRKVHDTVNQLHSNSDPAPSSRVSSK